ncbi:heme lyase CcmF/NrfE family subunit [Asticcacaulis sp. EMRT-3]|uniref:heme lyase CcmF/NrfE family subunit n=1 Tax=Asticcacaulis sp. EMRT-3 TaxID=3040349 RepID=UPI0024AEEC67|nr:heme lyase CcmF/NrfE family subunit [Asticcacaulis sp. EMRT-3]MDI7775367.1 heme lyase CcmF/NrfE family subunit [Asticcacaulis sp. EMRT-3]
MIDEIGNYCLILAFCFALGQAVLVGLDRFKPLRGIARWAEGVSLAAALSILISFVILIVAFIRSDFSVMNVYQHSHTEKPLLYKIAGAWGSHEGSMLLWCTILLVYGALITLLGRNLPQGLKLKALGVQGLLGAAFTGFTLFSSNPLARLDPAPVQGLSLNPALQDPALAFHPPMLYLGYIGFSVVFSFAVAALIEGRIDRAWARWIRPWVLTAWSFLTLGITLGAFWAYYELGWGGWWAWDPVENASFMPWLAATALLHSAIVMEKRDALKAWTVFLSLLAFTFSMLGAFLVRSGLLTSVHAFALDPTRGILLAIILFVTAGAGFALFAWRAPALSPGGLFAPVSREAVLVLNNLLISAGLCSVFLGTLYPILMQSLFDKTMSVGAPYYVAVFVPIMAAALLILPLSGLMAWRRAHLKGVVQRLAVAFGVAALAAVTGTVFYHGPWLSEIIFGLGLLIGFWLIFGTLKTLAERVDFKFRRLRGVPLAFYGMMLAHAGLGVFVLGAVVEGHERLSALQVMSPGDRVHLGHYDMRFTGLYSATGKNYDAQGGHFDIRDPSGHLVCRASPQRRFYPASNEVQSKVALCFRPLDDLYVVMAEPSVGPDGKPAWQIRFFVNPWVRLIFFGPLLMALGGVLSLSDRRLRLGVAARPKAEVRV